MHVLPIGIRAAGDSWKESALARPPNMGLTSLEVKLCCPNCMNFKEFPEEFPFLFSWKCWGINHAAIS